MKHALGAIGVDVGSTTTKLVAVDKAGEIRWKRLEPAHPRVARQVTRLLGELGADLGPLGAEPVVATGYGRKLVEGASRRVTEITCHARGVYRATGHGGTLVDIGGQDAKVIRIDDQGAVQDFAMNDKCAAGTGRFLEVVAARLHYPLDEMSEVALAATEEQAISSTCTVFAESEIISLIAHGRPIEAIVRGLHRALVRRIAALARGGTGVKAPLLLSGGVAQSAAVRALLSEELGVAATLAPDPQMMGAYGAALIGLGQRR